MLWSIKRHKNVSFIYYKSFFMNTFRLSWNMTVIAYRLSGKIDSCRSILQSSHFTAAASSLGQYTPKHLVKNKSILAGIRYLKMKQNKCEKGSGIKYESLELHHYLNPCSNLTIEVQRFIFTKSAHWADSV